MYLLSDVGEGKGQIGLGQALNVLLYHGLDRLLHETHISILKAMKLPNKIDERERTPMPFVSVAVNKSILLLPSAE